MMDTWRKLENLLGFTLDPVSAFSRSLLAFQLQLVTTQATTSPEFSQSKDF